MFCEKCGTKILEGAAFCENCGARVADMAADMPLQSEEDIINVVSEEEEQKHDDFEKVEAATDTKQEEAAETAPENTKEETIEKMEVEDIQKEGSENSSEPEEENSEENVFSQVQDALSANLSKNVELEDAANTVQPVQQPVASPQQPVSFCENCGTKLPAGAAFCENCGTKVAAVSQTFVQQPMQNEIQQKEPMSKWTKILIGQAVALVILVTLFYNKCSQMVSPEQVAEEYFVAVMSGDAKKAYDAISVEESDFVNAEGFQKVVDQIGCKQVSNYQVVSDVESQGQDGFSKEVFIQYRLKEDSNDYTFSVKLEKASTKKYLFFTDWKVNVGDYIQKDVSVTVLTNSKVTIDKKEVSSKYVDNKNTETGYTTYLIPKMFTGYYTVDVTNDMYEDWSDTFELVDGNNSFSEGEGQRVSVKKEIVENVANQAKKDFQNVWGNAKKQMTLSAVKDVSLSSGDTEISDHYQSLLEGFQLVDGEGLKSIDFKNLEVTAKVIDDSEEFGGITICVNFAGDFSKTETKTDFWEGKKYNETNDGQYDGSMYYVYESGKWKLADIYMADFY